MEDYAKDLFDQTSGDIFESEFNIDTEEVEVIDMDEIDESSSQDSNTLVDAFAIIDEKLLNSQPKLQQRIIQYKDTIRMHLKILKSSERVYDILINNIAKSPTNASLYTGLTRLQSSMADARNQISNTMNALETCMNNIELELNFDNNGEDGEPIATRGTRDFIKSIVES